MGRRFKSSCAIELRASFFDRAEVMNYRITGEFRAPFRIFPFLEESIPYKMELVIKARADLPDQNYGGNVTSPAKGERHDTIETYLQTP